MGIPKFRQFLVQQFPGCTESFPLKRRVHHTFIDLNGFLHVIARRARDHDHFWILLYKELDGFLKRIHPEHTFMVAVDGPASIAKLEKQRDRRFKSKEKAERDRARDQAGHVAVADGAVLEDDTVMEDEVVEVEDG
eukprot:CAMPEP_0119127126 /NCGR_PEP_ID=MMETSP1310-20130426/5790_1 /TAXON_ID=464262 /ORGANISM="Genus nov. species nov., Strain RCC2339" /LENGTH=135 /DNA_ID=CAMNT_0007117351 /DNA_START=90 /DNA_END=494 /DNA_ORIENTATION=-